MHRRVQRARQRPGRGRKRGAAPPLCAAIKQHHEHYWSIDVGSLSLEGGGTAAMRARLCNCE